MVQVKREFGASGYPNPQLPPPPGGDLGPYGAYLGAGAGGSGMAGVGAGAGVPGAGLFMMQGQMVHSGMMVGQTPMIPPHLLQQVKYLLL